MEKQTIFSGIQPSGTVHLGNYIGAIQNWTKLQQENDTIFCIVDLHSITVSQDAQSLKNQIKKLAALYLACGIDPKTSTIFVQSDVSEHAELAWILNTITNISELERMTQFKDKSKQHDSNVGLFNYPVLMASDILLYNTEKVPVGEDQTQHIELTRTLAKRFNNKFGETFKIPEGIFPKKQAKRIMGLDDPTSKMSKSAQSKHNYIALLDSKDEIFEKIKKAVTDSGKEITFSKEKPAISNLLTIYQAVTEKSETDTVDHFQDKSYRDLKEELAQAVIEFLKPIQERYKDILKDESFLLETLKVGAECAKIKASKKLKLVKEKTGLGT